MKKKRMTILLRSSWSVFAFCLLTVVASGCSKQEEPSRQQQLGQALSRADEYVVAERYDQAEKEYLNALRIAPGNTTAIRQLGIIWFDQGELPQALPYLKKS